MSDKELVERLLDFEKVTVGDARDAALRIEELEGKIAGVERAKDALEGLRPVWAQGWTDDSMAAQASGNALAQLWEMLGVQDQTQAVATLKALTEQLEAARADAKEAEAYAEGLEKEIELNEQEACMLEDDFIKAEKEIEALTTKLAAAVDWFETIRDRAKGDYMAHTYYLDALAALATIERSDAP
jgi:hypothetical protein